MDWIDVKEKLPEILYNKKKSNVEILLTDGKIIRIGFFRELFRNNEKGEMVKAGYMFNSFCKKCSEGDLLKPTHWTYLPKLPKKEKK